jgi:dTDP-4-amino-4,6-dideoxygalactose transaminase
LIYDSIHNYLTKTTLKKFSIYTTRASVALKIHLKSLEDQFPNKIIAIPAFLCHAPVSAIIDAGWTPYLLDNGLDDIFPSETEIQKAQEKNVGVFLWVHMFGIPHESQHYLKLSKLDNFHIIEDACLAFGAKVFDKAPGFYSDSVLFSFGTGKQLDLNGGGVIFYKNEYQPIDDNIHPLGDEEVFKKTFYQKIHSHQQSPKGNHTKDIIESYIPFSRGKIVPKLSNTFKIDVFEKEKTRKLELVDLYHSQVYLNSNVKVFKHNSMSPWRFTFLIRSITPEKKTTLCKQLRNNNIHVSHWYWPIDMFLRKDQYLDSGCLDNSKKLNEEIFQLWLGPTINKLQIENAFKIINSFISPPE